jgi:starch phosphorylase
MERYVPLPPLPGRISRLNELAYDLWWSWNPRGREVFRDLDYPLWRFTDHNPVLQLHLVEPDRLDHAAADPEFLRLYDDALAALDVVRAGAGTWWSRWAPGPSQPIAWIAREFALHQSLPVDASSNGVLSGDFCKEASDLGVPLVGIALMYPRAFAHQRLSAEGWQQEAYEYIDWSDAPISPALCPDGSRCCLQVTVGEATVHVVVWQVRAGRVSLFLLDTDVTDNTPWDRELSSTAFHGDPDGAMRQAVLLGAAGVKALELLGVQPAVWHVADAGAGLVVVERLHRLVAEGARYDDAARQVRETTVFATRQPSPAREGSCSFAALDRHLAGTWPALVAHRERVLDLGQLETDRETVFNSGALAARGAGVTTVPETAAGAHAADAWNSVRAAHATAGPERVHAIADGIHVPGWVSADVARLFERYVGEDWRDRQDEEAAWNAVRGIPDAEIWEVRDRLRGYLVDFVRERARRRWSREQASGARLVALGTLLDARTLTIGYARRFADAARPELIFQDVERLARIVAAERRPVQIVFAGKAHPNDETGKHHLQRVFRRALDPAFGGRVAFVEDYDLHVARLLVQGCDVWLSTPRRGCAPSIGGLIAAVNGGAHLATPDGWWADGCSGGNGWMIDGRPAADPKAQDAADARALYAILEERVVPAFYDRARIGIPVRWTAIVKESIATTLPRCCARRAVKAFAAAGYQAAVDQ